MRGTFWWMLGGVGAVAGLAWVAYAARPPQVADGAGVAAVELGRPWLRDDVTALLAHPDEAQVLYAGSRRGVFASADGGRGWRRVLGLRGADVYDLAVAPSRPLTVYLATARGLYHSDDGGRHWTLQALHRGGGAAETEVTPAVLAVAVHPTDPRTVAVGTPHGALLSRDGGVTWQPVAAVGEAAVRTIAYHPLQPAFLYIVAATGLYGSQDGGEHWARVLVRTSAADEEAEPDLSTADEPLGVAEAIGSIALDPAASSRVIVGTGRGVWQSGDAGVTWQPLPSVGLGHPVIRQLLFSPDDPDHLYAATSAGLFTYSSTWQAWRPLAEGLPTRDVRRLAWSPGGRALWVATNQGVYQVPLAPPTSVAPLAAALTPDAHRTLAAFAHEPTIAQVQAAAIRYAEVMPEKIRSWRTRAAWRPWVPHFTLGLDRGTDTTVASATSGGKTTFTVGPKDRSLGVKFGFTWDLADFIWNPSQTSIDVRSRLMVQLRNDIVDEATRLYFERRRLQVEDALLPVKEPTLQAERRLRIDELTAQLDGLTGGNFSARLQAVGPGPAPSANPSGGRPTGRRAGPTSAIPAQPTKGE